MDLNLELGHGREQQTLHYVTSLDNLFQCSCFKHFEKLVKPAEVVKSFNVESPELRGVLFFVDYLLRLVPGKHRIFLFENHVLLEYTVELIKVLRES